MITFGPNGLVIDTFDQTLAEIQDDFRAAFGDAISTRPNSSAGQIQNLIALRESQWQEALLQLYQALDPRHAEGVLLDQRNALLGIDREPADEAEVLGTATGTPATNIPNGTVLSVGGFLFDVIDGPYVIGGGGTVANVRVRAQTVGPKDVTTLGAWSIVTNVPGFTGYNDTSQPNLGALVEQDAAYRVRAEIERYRRGNGPLLAIQASVSSIDAVTYVRAFHNITTDPVDANGIPYHAINVVVEGGDDADIAEAIWDAGPAGHLFFGAEGPFEVDDGTGGTVQISFDRVEQVDMWINLTLTTSTSEEETPDDLEALVVSTLLEFASEEWQIGTDVTTRKIAGALNDIEGIDAIACTISLDDGGTDPYSTAKRAISIRQRAVLAEARITVVEV